MTVTDSRAASAMMASSPSWVLAATHTGRGAAYNAQMAGAIRAAGLPVAFITPSEYERA